MSIRFLGKIQIGFMCVSFFKTNGLKKAPTPRGEVQPRISRNSVKDEGAAPRQSPGTVSRDPYSFAHTKSAHGGKYQPFLGPVPPTSGDAECGE